MHPVQQAQVVKHEVVAPAVATPPVLAWPSLPETILPKNLNDDDFYRKSVVILEDKSGSYVKLCLTRGMHIPHKQVEQLKDGEVTTDALAHLLMQDILVDLQAELYPLLRRKMQEYFKA